jgi:transposase-like protein
VRYQRKGLGSRSGEDIHPGCSTRKVKVIKEQLATTVFLPARSAQLSSAWTVSCRNLPADRWRKPYAYLIVDARYEKDRKSGSTKVANGIARPILAQA